MQFGCTIPRILRHILEADPMLRPVFMSNMDLFYGYMHIWIRTEDTPPLDFFVSQHSTYIKPLIGFHLSLQMGYVKNELYFFYTSDITVGIANVSWHD